MFQRNGETICNISHMLDFYLLFCVCMTSFDCWCGLTSMTFLRLFESMTFHDDLPGAFAQRLQAGEQVTWSWVRTLNLLADFAGLQRKEGIQSESHETWNLMESPQGPEGMLKHLQAHRELWITSTVKTHEKVTRLTEDSVVQFITILLPERHQRHTVSESGEHSDGTRVEVQREAHLQYNRNQAYIEYALAFCICRIW